MISDNKNNPYIKQHDWDKPKDKPELTYEMMVQLAVVKEEPVLDDLVDDNISWDFTKPKKDPMIVEWIDGHKLDDVNYTITSFDAWVTNDTPAIPDAMWTSRAYKDRMSKNNDPVFTTDKDGYVYVDFDQDTMLMKDYIKKITK